MRCEYVGIGGERYVPTFEQRLECAAESAPYYAPKLNSVTLNQGFTDAQLLEVIAETARANPDILKAIVRFIAGPEGGTTEADRSSGFMVAARPQ